MIYDTFYGQLKSTVPSPSNHYRDRVCKSIETTGFYHTILKFPEELGPDIYLTEQVQCKVCGNASTSFDPFSSVQLPLPLPEKVPVEAVRSVSIHSVM